MIMVIRLLDDDNKSIYTKGPFKLFPIFVTNQLRTRNQQ